MRPRGQVFDHHDREAERMNRLVGFCCRLSRVESNERCAADKVDLRYVLAIDHAQS